MERPNPQSEQSRDDALLERELRQAELEDRLIPVSVARLIASRWHGGQESALYAFQSSGAISYDIADEVTPEFNDLESTPSDRRELDHLVRFINAQEVDEDGERGPQPDWNERTRWDFGDQEPLITESGYDSDDECIYCGAHLSEAHDPGCPRTDDDLEEDLA